MGEGKLTQRQRRAYSYAAIATAMYVSKMIPIGPIDLADYDYRSAKLIEFRWFSISTKTAGLLAPRQLP